MKNKEILIPHEASYMAMKGEQHHYPKTKKDESLRNFHWFLIRTLHNFPFLTDGKSINVYVWPLPNTPNTTYITRVTSAFCD